VFRRNYPANRLDMTTNATVRGTIRSGENPTSRGGNDIDVDVSEKDFNAYWEGEDEPVRWLVIRTGGAEFNGIIINTYKWLEIGGTVFQILGIHPESKDKSRLLVTVQQSDIGSSAGFLD
jgi:hypothetical protein